MDMTDDLWSNHLLEPPLDVDDTLSVVPVGELTKDLLAEVDVTASVGAGRTAVGYHTLKVSKCYFFSKPRGTYGSLGTGVGVLDGNPLTAFRAAGVFTEVQSADVVIVAALVSS
jgi:hypothetical protein